MSTTPHILVIFGSTRQGRRGEVVATWLMNRLALRTDVTVEMVDLREVALPFFDSPELSTLCRDHHQRTNPEDHPWLSNVSLRSRANVASTSGQERRSISWNIPLMWFCWLSSGGFATN